MIDPPRWSADDLDRNAALATEIFRKERLEEPLEAYLEAFDDYQGSVEDLFETTIDLTNLEGTAAEFVPERRLLVAFRYLAGPMVSDDDLKVVAEIKSLTPSRLRNDPEGCLRIVEVIRMGLDRRRFPWVNENREPTEAEKQAAIIGTVSLMATQRVGTKRRHQSKKAQEEKVEGALTAIGFTRVANRTVNTYADAPKPGEFCRESMLGIRKADFIVGLWDQRIMAIECKVSNSSTNSVKRLNNDAAVKAKIWRTDFGERQVVPVAVLGGVYKLHNLVDAQDRGLTLIWAHELKALRSAEPCGRSATSPLPSADGIWRKPPSYPGPERLVCRSSKRNRYR